MAEVETFDPAGPESESCRMKHVSRPLRFSHRSLSGRVPSLPVDYLRSFFDPRSLDPQLRAPEPNLPPEEPAPQYQSAAPSLPPLPEAISEPAHGVLASFLAVVALPLLLISGYYVFFASNQYVAEFRFTVTEVSPQLASVQGVTPSTSSSGASALSGIASSMGLGGIGISNSTMNNYMVIDYLKSPQAIEDLQKQLDVKKIFSSSKYDWFARFDNGKPTEKFVEYWRGMTNFSYDPMTGLASAQVRAFEPQDAVAIAKALVRMSEQLVNRLKERAAINGITFAEKEAEKAQQRLKRVRTELAEFRIKEGIVDPNGNVGTNIELTKNLRANLLQLQTELSSLNKQAIGMGSASAKVLVSRIEATQDQLRAQEREMSKEREANGALVSVVGRYEQLDLDRQFAQAMALSTLQALDQARANAAAQHLYLTPYVMPTRPESSAYPKRLYSILSAGAVLMVIWVTGFMVVRSIREQF